MRLKDVFAKHKCDKFFHGYDIVYEGLTEPDKLLEIGIFKGASIASWLEWFPNTRITAIDTFQRLPANSIPALRNHRVVWWKGDSQTIKGVEGPFEVIIDDGNHHSHVQLATFKNLITLMSDGGRYFIEDCKPDNPEFQDLVNGLAGFNVEHHDLRGLVDSYLLEVTRF